MSITADALPALVGASLFLVAALALGQRRGALPLVAAWAGGGLILAGIAALVAGGGSFAPRAAAYALAAVTFVSLIAATEAGKTLAKSLVVGAVGWIAMDTAQANRAAGQPPETPFATLFGETVTLSERVGRPLVLNLWATWCGPCRREMPMMMQVADDMAGIDVVFANQGEDPQRIQAFLTGATLEGDRILLDPDRSLMAKHGVIGLPATYFFDGTGRLRRAHVGEIRRDDFLEAIEAIQNPTD